MFKFAIKNMMIKRVKVLLVVFSIIISAGVGLLAYNVSRQVRDGIVNTAAYYDIIIGPSGSSTQLAMNTMFFTDTPLGTIDYKYVEELRKNPNVNTVVPFCMGDSYNSSRVIGTTPDFLNGKELESGTMFSATFDAVIGADVASRYNLKVGDKLITSHGLSSVGTEHTTSPLIVTGVLRSSGTAYDNAVFTSCETVWSVHDHGEHEEEGGEHEEEGEEHEENTVCAILLRCKSVAAYSSVTEYYSADSSLLVINPSTVLREVLENVDLSSKIVYLLCIIILIMNILVISVITLLNLYDSRKEISLMRLIGISMGKVNLLFLIQNAIIGLVSSLLALGASRLCIFVMSDFVAGMGVVLSPAIVYPIEFAILAVVFAISVLPTVICTFMMSRKDGLDN